MKYLVNVKDDCGINFELLIKLLDPDIIGVIVSNFLIIACIVCLRFQRFRLKP